MIKFDVKDQLSDTCVDKIITALDGGEVIVYPTDTLYGLGADASSEAAVAKLFQMKSRKDVPVSVLLGSVNQLFNMATDLDDKAKRLINKFLPGALTVICKSSYPFAKQLFSAAGTIGFRIPGDKISTQVPTLFGGPITTTSVNPAGQPAATTFSEVQQYFGEELALMLDAGSLNPSKGSTVIDLTAEPFEILREGEISRQALQDYLN